MTKKKPKYKIEKGIKIPPAASVDKFPLRDMEIGDSFCVVLPKDEEGEKKVKNSIASRVQYYQKLLGIRCATRSVKERGVLKIRVWRTE